MFTEKTEQEKILLVETHTMELARLQRGLDLVTRS
jgi:hypothetical protein